MIKNIENTFLGTVWDYVKTIFLALLIAFVIRAFWFEPYKIPSSSMVPTLQIGDFLFVNKFTYGLRMPFTEKIFMQEEPKRGDIVVFQRVAPELPGSFFGFGPTYFIKRVVGLPGDTIAYRGKQLVINGVTVPVSYQESLKHYEHGVNASDVQLFEEHLGDIVHDIYFYPSRMGMDVEEMVVPEGHYVMVGDNRDNSHDSRGWEYPEWAFIKREDIVGRASFIFMSLQENWMPRFERFFTSLNAQSAIKN